MIRWLACPVFLQPIDLPLPRRGAARPSRPRRRWGQLPEGWGVRAAAPVSLDAFRGGEPIRWRDAGVEMRGNAAAMKVSDNGDVFLLPMRFEIVDSEGRVRDFASRRSFPGGRRNFRPAQAGRQRALLRLPRRRSDGHGGLSDRGNWQDRVQYGFTWHNPNGLRVAGDALKMAAAGMRIVRTHYMMPGWMRTVPGQIYARRCRESTTNSSWGRSFPSGTSAPSRPTS